MKSKKHLIYPNNNKRNQLIINRMKFHSINIINFKLIKTRSLVNILNNGSILIKIYTLINS